MQINGKVIGFLTFKDGKYAKVQVISEDTKYTGGFRCFDLFLSKPEIIRNLKPECNINFDFYSMRDDQGNYKQWTAHYSL